MNTIRKSLAVLLGGTCIAAVMTLAVIPVTSLAEEKSGLEVGVLTCKKIPGTFRYYLVHSTVGIDCVFTHTQGVEHYSGRAGIGLGIDLNWKSTEDMAYSVIGGTSDVQPAAHWLSGTYLGGRVSATVGAGGGVAVLVGGGDKNISLQPLALEFNTGIGAAAGIGYMALEPGDA